MTEQTPPTDRPLTAGDVPLLREGDVLRDYAGRTCVFDHMVRDDYLWARIGEGSLTGAGLGSFTFVVRPATSAASEGEVGLDAIRSEIEEALDRNGLAERGWTKKAIDEAIAAVPTRSRFSKAEAGVVMPIIERILSAPASPPVSERERELEGALRTYDAAVAPCPINGTKKQGGGFENCTLCGASMNENCGLEASASYAFIKAVRALTAQPAGEGK